MFNLIDIVFVYDNNYTKEKNKNESWCPPYWKPVIEVPLTFALMQISLN